MLRSFLQHTLLFSAMAITPWVSAQPPSQQEAAMDADQIHHFISTLALVKHYYFEDISTQDLIQQAIHGMVGQLDPHSSYLTPEYLQQLQHNISGEFGGIGIEVTSDGQGSLKVVTPIDGTPAARVGLKAQDLIVKINESLVQELDINQAIGLIRGKIGTTVKLVVIRQGHKQPLQFDVMRDTIKIESVEHQLLDQQYGYIKLSTFQSNGKPAMLKAISQLQQQSKQPLRGLILDLRNNPGGLLHVAVEISDLFLDLNELKHQGRIVSTQGKHPENSFDAKATSGEVLGEAPIVVLMNQGSASAAEIVAGALQDHKRALVVGKQSFGKGSVQTIIPTLHGKGAVKLTTALYYTPKGRSIQAKGITPDLVVADIKLADNQTEAVAFMPLSEAELNGHIQAPKSTETAQAPTNSTNDDAWRKDHQLQQALNILKGLSALKPKSLSKNTQ